MKRLINLFVALLLTSVSALSSCKPTEGAAEQIRRTVKLADSYKKITVRNGLIVNYKPQTDLKTTTCTIVGTQDAVNRVRVTVDDGELEIYIKGGWIGDSGPAPIINLTGRAVADIETSSAATLNLSGSISTRGTFGVECNSASVVNVAGNVSCRDMELDLSSASTFNITGRAAVSNALEIDGSSASTVRMTANCSAAYIDLSSGALLSLGGTAGRASVDTSSGAVADLQKLTVKGKYSVDASSGSIVTISGSDVSIEKNSGAIVNRK